MHYVNNPNENACNLLQDYLIEKWHEHIMET